MLLRTYSLRNLVQKVTMLWRWPADFGLLHPYRGLRRRAHEDTLDFMSAEMPRAIAFSTSRDLLLYSLGLVSLDGLVLEFGVYSGRTVNLIAKRLKDRSVDGFDSFEGLPESWHGNRLQAEFFSAKPPRVRSNVRLHVGWFSDTLPEFVTQHPEPVAFLHVDCDLYSSTATIFEHLEDRIVPGTVIVFDEYFNYPGWRDHEHRAFTEFVARSGRAFEYVAYAANQVTVVIRSR